MRPASIIIGAVLCAALLSGQAVAENKAWGWRGEDGTGVFTETDPPIKWGRISETIQGIRIQAEKPAGKEASGIPLDCGGITEWLIVGPVAEEGALDESSVQPNAGDRVGGAEWKKYETEDSLLFLDRLLPQIERGQTYYAHAYVHSRARRTAYIQAQSSGSHFFLNGRLVQRIKKIGHTQNLIYDSIVLEEGWNRLLFKMEVVTPRPSYLRLVIWGGEKNEKYKETGIRWSAPLPRGGGTHSVAQPLIVGNRIFVNADNHLLVCFDKNTGKRLWVTFNGFPEIAAPEERKANPEIFAQVDRIVARMKELADNYEGKHEQRKELRGLALSLKELMTEVSEKKYGYIREFKHHGVSGCTSETDGKHIYTWYTTGIAVCHDLDGNRKWITFDQESIPEGRYKGMRQLHIWSPILTEDEFIVKMYTVTGLDKKTGKVKWKIPGPVKAPQRWPDCTVPRTSPDTDIIYYYNVGVYKPGKGLYSWSTSTQVGNRYYVQFIINFSRRSPMRRYTVPDEITPTTTLGMGSVPLATMTFDKDNPLTSPGVLWSEYHMIANALHFKDVLYLLSKGGIVYACDEETLKPYYNKLLPLNTITYSYPYPHGSGVCASPTAAGDYVYFWGPAGVCLVIKPGPKYEVVARNNLEQLLPGGITQHRLRLDGIGVPECTVSSPIFEGSRMYYRAENYLYCIEKP